MLITFLYLAFGATAEQPQTHPGPQPPESSEEKSGNNSFDPVVNALEEAGRAFADAAKKGELPY